MAFNKAAAFRLWRQRNALLEESAQVAREAQKKYERVMAMMERAAIRSVKDDETGETITYVAPQPVVIDFDGLIADLERSAKGRAIIRRCTVKVVDHNRLAAEANEGNIPSRLVRARSSIKPVKPHLR